MRTIFTAVTGLAVAASGSTMLQSGKNNAIQAKTISSVPATVLHGRADIQDSMSLVEKTSAETAKAESQRKKMGLRRGQQARGRVSRRGGGFLSTQGSFTLSGGSAAGDSMKNNIPDSMSLVEKSSAETAKTESQRKKTRGRVSRRGGGFSRAQGSITLSGVSNGQR